MGVTLSFILPLNQCIRYSPLLIISCFTSGTNRNLTTILAPLRTVMTNARHFLALFYDYVREHHFRCLRDSPFDDFWAVRSLEVTYIRLVMSWRWGIVLHWFQTTRVSIILFDRLIELSEWDALHVDILVYGVVMARSAHSSELGVVCKPADWFFR